MSQIGTHIIFKPCISVSIAVTFGLLGIEALWGYFSSSENHYL